MRTTGIVLALALIAALTAFSLHQQSDLAIADAPLGRLATVVPPPPTIESREAIRVQASIAVAPAVQPTPDPTDAAPASRARVASTAPRQPGAAPAPPVVQERTQEARRRTRSSRRSSRYRSRNRYPGPIPTPADWEPPPGPVRIALQAGHWRANEAPAELSGLKDNGTSANGVPEWEVNLEVVRRTAAQLEELGYEVDVLPAVVPPGYRAHLFIAVHADGSNDPAASGYRVAAPRRDATGRAERFVDLLERSYGEATGIRRLPTVTRRMQSYYAFNFRRYEHALHPMTIGVIIETGFLTSARDRRVIVQDPDRAARGIVEAVQAFPITALPEAQEGR